MPEVCLSDGEELCLTVQFNIQKAVRPSYWPMGIDWAPSIWQTDVAGEGHSHEEVALILAASQSHYNIQ